jgi:dTDP-4-amino-4,6-dideoxygalactose transaminase
MNIPFVNLAAQHAPIKTEVMAAVERVLDHGQFILGNEVDEFECRFADLCGTSNAVGVNSGTDALILALRALEVGPGDEVITVSNSFVASTGCIALVGASPVFVDVREDYNMDPGLIEEAITERTKAILLVHLTGRPADMDPIMDISRKHGLYVIEDSAQAVGAEYKGKRVGSFGDIGCFSLHPLKTLNACGDGGVLTTNDASLYEELKILRNLGLRDRDDCVVWGLNSRLDTLQAAILLVKLGYVDEWTDKRRAHALFYQNILRDLPQIKCPEEESYERSVYHTFVVQAHNREALRKYLSSKNIGTAVHYPIPIHLHKAAATLGYGVGSFPVTERQAGKILSLPVYPELQADQLEYVVSNLQNFYQQAGT